MPRRFFQLKNGTPLLAVGASLFVGWLFLTIVSLGPDWAGFPDSWRTGFAYEVDNDRMPTATFLAVNGVLTLLVGFVAFRLCKNQERGGGRLVLLFAVATRLVAIFGEPIHESDFYRYAWDGQSSLAGVNPYEFEPGALLLRDTSTIRPFPDPETEVTWQGRIFSAEEEETLDRLDQLWDSNPQWYERISHKAVPTIYPPFAQFVFAICTGIFGWSSMGMKIVFLLFDVGTILLIVSILKRLGKNPAWVLLYAWHPLVVKEFANSAHYDAVPIFFCFLALWLAVARPESVRRALMIGIVLGLGALAKYFAVLLLPILLWKSRSLRNLLIGAGSCGAVVFLGFLPFAIWSDVGWARLFEGLRIYGNHWEYNPGVFAMTRRLLEVAGDGAAFQHAGWICALLLLAVVAWLTFRSRLCIEEKCFAAMGALFVLSPTAFPWYLCWTLAFLPFRPSWSWLVLSLLIPLNYLDFKSESVAPIAHAEVGGIYILSGTIWIVFAVCWIVENTRGKSRCLREGTESR